MPGFALGEQDRAGPELPVRQRRDQQFRRVGPRIARAVEIEEAVGLAAGDRGQPMAQFGLAQTPVPDRVVVDEKAGGLVLRVADQQRDVVRECRRFRVAGLLRQVMAIDDRAEIVAVEQRQLGPPHNLLCRGDRRDQLLDWKRRQPVE